MRHADPFTHTGTVTRDTLERYVRGELSTAERHAVELRMEQDPLLREAVEGLSLPGALAGLSGMKPRTTGGPGTVLRILGAGVLIVAGLTAAVLWVNEEPVTAPPPVVLVPDTPFAADSVIAVMAEELSIAQPMAIAQRIGHGPAREKPAAPLDTVHVRPIERIDSASLQVSVPPSTPTPKELPSPSPASRSNRQLAFVHDLKLVHPKELYEPVPLILEPGGVPASYMDGADMRERSTPPRTMRYLDYMDEALGRFVRNDEQGCLKDLVVLLGQYPSDVNARFYAGLCCYNLGLPSRAMGYLEAVVEDPIDTFHEEAAWYLALSTERAHGAGSAEAQYRKIAEAGGFYAPQAAAKLGR